jgi:ATP-dependent Clp protease adaptor protein ClpS
METSKSNGNIKKRRPRRKRLHIYLMNDDFNSFEYVIKVLMAILGHNVYQAQQCAEITHNVGKCHIYSALGNDAYFTFEQLTKHGLSVKLTHKKL